MAGDRRRSAKTASKPGHGDHTAGPRAAKKK